MNHSANRHTSNYDEKSPPVWYASLHKSSFPALHTNLSVDIAIIGGGITGIAAAAELTRAGRSVIVLEAHDIGSGTSGHSTGNLYALLGNGLYNLRKKWGDDVVEQVVQSRLQAIDFIERNIKEHRLACDFVRVPWCLYSIAGLPDELTDIEHEYNAARSAGLDAHMTNDLPLPYMIMKALVVKQQAQFNPYLYVRQLASSLFSRQCQIFEQSTVTQIDADAGLLQVQVSDAIYSVRADHIVMATHIPKGLQLLHTELAPYREYAVAAPIEKKTLPNGIFWSTGINGVSTRLANIADQAHVVLVGEKSKSGQNDHPETSWQKLNQRLYDRFNIEASTFQWAAQQYRSADDLPYIGSSATSSHLYLATGFGPDGLTYGSLAGKMIADEICGQQNSFIDLYTPRRFTPMKSAKNFLKENMNVATRYVKDYTQSAPLKNFADLPAGEGAVIEVKGQRVAAYRDEVGKLHALSPVCTHLKCIVHWNNAEKSWDCPCHGSRFDVDGSIIEGPALNSLPPISDID